ncbi:glycosyltransferase [Pseudoprimorskyibacter insulae]|uniref:N-acetylglucosaminyl-diphospho-decaprenol L-rhamnosyltransferase n=1 Tax=Pseudoprimorskyibacter insulae TaxID=1695997 RepID=A0A2R8AU21_9RHOB|nr:glycosyltransferase family 2 protein [Pseudoprimorskyibacter insulae]SPF79480.1 N-acetylglucosaminyl-diphospho-decaprenol L-rhamnosyltransferase [Pseudoprimorskyibacter insulae]
MSTVLTVILNYKTADMTLDAARAAARAMRGIDGAITIVDNDSGDGSYEKMCAAIEVCDWSEGTPIRVLDAGRNGGFGAGNNFGILAGLPDGSAPDYVYLLNSDAFPDEGAIHALRDYLDRNADASLVGSYLRYEDGTDHVSSFRFPTIWSEFVESAKTGLITRLFGRHTIWMPIPDASGPVDWLAGASMMARQSTLDEIGLFDETFFLYFEETELFYRAKQAGHLAHFVRESRVMHKSGVSTGMDVWDRVPAYWYNSRWYYFSKCRGRAYAVSATGFRLLGSLVWQLRRLIQGKPRIDPHRFFRDLVRHDLAAMVKPVPASTFPRKA